MCTESLLTGRVTRVLNHRTCHTCTESLLTGRVTRVLNHRTCHTCTESLLTGRVTCVLNPLMLTALLDLSLEASQVVRVASGHVVSVLPVHHPPVTRV